MNLLRLDENEGISQCLNVREFPDDLYLIMATRNGLIKKTALSAYSRPMKGGIIAIRLDDDDKLIDVRIVGEGDDVVVATATGMSIRFSHTDARSMGRATRGVKGVSLSKGDSVVGLVRVEGDRTLLTVCENGYGKRTPFGPGELASEDEEDSVSSNMQYRRQKRGGKGLRDIRTSERNGKVVDILSVLDDDHVLMITRRGKIQRIRVSDISQIGRNTQGVRVIRLDDGDSLVSCARIPNELQDETEPVEEDADGGDESSVDV